MDGLAIETEQQSACRNCDGSGFNILLLCCQESDECNGVWPCKGAQPTGKTLPCHECASVNETPEES